MWFQGYRWDIFVTVCQARGAFPEIAAYNLSRLRERSASEARRVGALRRVNQHQLAVLRRLHRQYINILDRAAIAGMRGQ